LSTAPSPFSWDADEKDRQTAEHVAILTRLAHLVAAAGLLALEGTGDPPCDLLFQQPSGALVVIEAKKPSRRQ
jgi:hypothetical protein